MERTAFIGFGEAARAFAGAPEWRRNARAFDVKLLDPAGRAEMMRACAEHGVEPAESAAEAVAGASLVVSVVTADQAIIAAASVAAHLGRGTLFCDCNSVAPDTKRRAATIVEAAGGHYVDVAVMSPVFPARLSVPLLLGGPHAADGAAALAALGFANVGGPGGEVGSASAIKMIRSVMVKGLEALTAECFLAAEAAGVRHEVAASLDASWPGVDWAAKTDYNLERMMSHGLRRAEELEEVVRTLDALGTGSAMSRGTVERQRAIGRLRIAPPDGLHAKLRLLAPFVADTPTQQKDAA